MAAYLQLISLSEQTGMNYWKWWSLNVILKKWIQRTDLMVSEYWLVWSCWRVLYLTIITSSFSIEGSNWANINYLILLQLTLGIHFKVKFDGIHLRLKRSCDTFSSFFSHILCCAMEDQDSFIINYIVKL